MGGYVPQPEIKDTRQANLEIAPIFLVVLLYLFFFFCEIKDTKVYREIADSINDTRSLQTDIDRLATLWQLKFNLENCETMRITRNKDEITPSYTMGRFTLEQFFSKFLNVSGFISFRVFGSVGVYTKRKFGFFTVYTGRQIREHSMMKCLTSCLLPRQRETKCRQKKAQR